MRILFLLLLLTACGSQLAPTPARADVYKWQDEEGLWHFSDRPPTEDEEFETVRTPYAPQAMVSERRGGTQREPRHYFFNRYHGPAEIELSLIDARNVKSTPPLPARFMLPGNSEKELVQLGEVKENGGFSYRLSYQLVPGPALEEIPDNLDFYPPFSRGEAFPISQGLDDDETHKDPANRYAVDIVMPMGTPVLAARSGVVMNFEDNHPDNGQQLKKLMTKANFIRILHDDGTMGVYAHLQEDSARVYGGMRIPNGYWIANSGNSGYSSGPHLHFVVQINIGMSLESLPLRFRRPGGGVMDPDRPQPLRGVLTEATP